MLLFMWLFRRILVVIKEDFRGYLGGFLWLFRILVVI